MLLTHCGLNQCFAWGAQRYELIKVIGLGPDLQTARAR